MALRSNVTDLQHNFARNLLLDIQVEVFHIGGLDILVECEDVAFGRDAARRNDGAGWSVVNGTRADASVHGHIEQGLLDRVWLNVVIRRSGSVKSWIR